MQVCAALCPLVHLIAKLDDSGLTLRALLELEP